MNNYLSVLLVLLVSLNLKAAPLKENSSIYHDDCREDDSELSKRINNCFFGCNLLNFLTTQKQTHLKKNSISSIVSDTVGSLESVYSTDLRPYSVDDMNEEFLEKIKQNHKSLDGLVKNNKKSIVPIDSDTEKAWENVLSHDLYSVSVEEMNKKFLKRIQRNHKSLDGLVKNDKESIVAMDSDVEEAWENVLSHDLYSVEN